MKRLLPIVLLAVSLGLLMSSASALSTSPPGASAAGIERVAAPRANPDLLRRILRKLSGNVMLRAAKQLGITAIGGKQINLPSKEEPRPRAIIDTSIFSDPVYHENEPSIAANPTNDRVLVAASHVIDLDECYAYVSTNGGTTWEVPTALPLAQAGDFCSDPVVRFAPDGEFAYVAYLSVRSDVSTSDVLVNRITLDPFADSISTDGPYTAITGVAPDFPDKPWLDVHPFDATQADYVYVTTTIFRGDAPFDCDIIFSSSSDDGVTWADAGAPLELASSSGCDPVVVQGSRPIGGLGTNVLACWYNSEADGFLFGVFDIRCRRSPDNGATWGAEVTAANNVLRELPEFLCPFDAGLGVYSYHRSWGAMFPSITIAPDGSAHIVFTRDPDASVLNSECGDVMYTRSTVSPYTSWVLPTLIADSGSMFQGYATIVAQRRPLGRCFLHVSWMDHRFSPGVGAFGAGPNVLYDIFRRSSGRCASPAWGTPSRVSDVSSMSDFVFVGDYIDSSATNRKVHAIWTDRGDKVSVLDPEDDVSYDLWTP